jgi:hypothetical protein
MMTTHDWSNGSQFCSCGQDTVTCQGCGRLVCGDVAIWVSPGQYAMKRSIPLGNIGPCCVARFGLGHAGRPPAAETTGGAR